MEQLCAAVVPRIWGGGSLSLPKLNLQGFKFGWEFIGTLERLVLMNTIHLMGTADYYKARVLTEMESINSDVRIFGATGSFEIPEIENGTSVLHITASLSATGRDIARLDGNVITGENIELAPGTTNIKLDVDPNVALNDQIHPMFRINHRSIVPGLDFSLKQYQRRNYIKQHYRFLGIKTFRRLIRTKN